MRILIAVLATAPVATRAACTTVGNAQQPGPRRRHGGAEQAQTTRTGAGVVLDLTNQEGTALGSFEGECGAALLE